MNVFFKRVLQRINKNTKIIKIILEQLQRKQRKYTTLRNHLNVLEIIKEHGML